MNNNIQDKIPYCNEMCVKYNDKLNKITDMNTKDIKRVFICKKPFRKP